MPYFTIDLEKHFPFITNIMGCLVTDGKLDFIVEKENDFWTTKLGEILVTTYYECHLGTEFENMFEHLEMFFTSKDLGTIDIEKVFTFMKGLSR